MLQSQVAQKAHVFINLRPLLHSPISLKLSDIFVDLQNSSLLCFIRYDIRLSSVSQL